MRGARHGPPGGPFLEASKKSEGSKVSLTFAKHETKPCAERLRIVHPGSIEEWLTTKTDFGK